MEIREIIESSFRSVCHRRNIQPPEVFSDDMVLLQSGLDSLGFAILVAHLEAQLGYDPFTLMDTPFYPRTFSEFVNVYQKFANYRTQ